MKALVRNRQLFSLASWPPRCPSTIRVLNDQSAFQEAIFKARCSNKYRMGSRQYVGARQVRCLSTQQEQKQDQQEKPKQSSSEKESERKNDSGPFTARLYEALNLQTFTREEFGEAFDRM